MNHHTKILLTGPNAFRDIMFRLIIVLNVVKIGRLVVEILHFSNFQHGRCRHRGFFEIEKFYWLLGLRGSRLISMPNFVQIGKSVAKILRFFDFSRWRRPPSWIDEFTKFHWLTVPDGPDASLQQIS